MDRSIVLVGLGGLLGSVLRYLVALFFAGQFSSAIPYATLTVNIVGCFLVGILFALSDRGNILTPEWRVFLTTGFCGGFTTFSTFSYESIKLMQDGEFYYVSLNVAASIVIGFGATYLGILLIKSI